MQTGKLLFNTLNGNYNIFICTISLNFSMMVAIGKKEVLFNF